MSRYERRSIADICTVGPDMRMNVADVMEEFQHALSEHGDLMGIGFGTMRKCHNAKWVITKIRFEIDRLPENGEQLSTVTWALKPGAIRFNRAFVMHADGREAVRALSDWCVIRCEDEKIVRSSEIKIDTDEFPADRAITTPFACLKFEPQESDLRYSRTVLLSDLDFNGHVNNVSYIKMAMDCFSAAEMHDMDMRTFEIHYARQCYEGETVSFYRRADGDGWLIAAKCGGEQVFTAFVNK